MVGTASDYFEIRAPQYTDVTASTEYTVTIAYQNYILSGTDEKGLLFADAFTPTGYYTVSFERRDDY